MNWYVKSEHQWRYHLIVSQSFEVPELNLGAIDVFSIKNELLANSDENGTLTILPYYSWDGCTGIGRLIETDDTLKASLLHDFLYQLAEQINYSAPFTQRQADKAFRRYLPLWASLPWYIGVRLAGWRFFGGDENTLIIKPTNDPFKMKIALDIGHAHKTGATANGYEEHAICAQIAPLVAQILKVKHEVKIIDFPDMSNSDDLSAAVEEANSWGADIFVSLHCDFSDNEEAHGAHVIHYPSSSKGKALAESIAASLTAHMPGRAEKVTTSSSLYVLKHTNMPAALAELGFISNKDDLKKLLDYESMAEILAQGIIAYCEKGA